MSNTILRLELKRLAEVWPTYHAVSEVLEDGYEPGLDVDDMLAALTEHARSLRREADDLQEELDDVEKRLDVVEYALAQARGLNTALREGAAARDQLDIVVRLHAQYGVPLPSDVECARDFMQSIADRQPPDAPLPEASLFDERNPTP